MVARHGDGTREGGVDDESGWNAILVEGWGDLVRAAVCERVEDRFATRRGVLMVAVTEPDDAPADAVERVHDAIVAAIAAETGADLDELGSQAAWATYDDVWAELGRRAARSGMEVVPPSYDDALVRQLGALPRPAIEAAGAVIDGLDVRLVRDVTGASLLDVEGLFRWLATDERADQATRDRARSVIATARSGG